MIPVILIHKTESYPLNPVVVEQARKYGNLVVVLGEKELARYWRGASEFEKHYEHLSTNHRAFELFCITRWFALRDWLDDQRREQVLYIDSDVLLYCNAEAEYPTWGEGYALTLALGTSPATSYITRAGLHAFCDFVNSIYIGHNAVWDEFHRIYREMRAQNLPGGVCDMTLFRYFKQEVRHVKVGEMTEVRGGATWDHNINVSDGYVMQDGIKRVHFDYGQPVGVQNDEGFHAVRFNALHFQNGAKRFIQEYAR